MNSTLFGMGLPEILAIAALTLLIFGPERLPGLMRNMGKTIRKMREVYIQLSSELQKELGPYAKEIDEATRELRQDLNTIREVSDVRNLIPPISLNGDPSSDVAKPTHDGPVDSAGVPLSPVNDTPMPYPSADAGPTATVEPSPAESASLTAAAAELPSAPALAPAVEERVAPPPASAESAPAPSTDSVVLSDDNPWKA